VVENTVSPQSLPSSIEEIIRTITRLYADHRQNATPFQRAVDLRLADGHRRGFLSFTPIAQSIEVEIDNWRGEQGQGLAHQRPPTMA
jgi:hypothetical protein